MGATLRTLGPILGLSIWLASCQPAFINGMPNEDSPYFTVPVGSALVLLQPLNVPARVDRLYFQRGRSLPWNEVNRYSAYCTLRLDVPAERARIVEPDRFVVRATSTEHLFQLADSTPTLLMVLATSGLWATADRDDSGRESYEVVASVMALTSTRQPDVIQLTCADWGLPQRAPYITVRKIREALGLFFDLDLGTR